ncbi:MAG TPA: YicC/YloC family endoribonuclease [Pyrinomonadaceae bacterium]|jgi:TIGR00255 family protein|nr:YicC/YloC family endoribonuclease [Pyrinomonadaceae bacterium]
MKSMTGYGKGTVNGDDFSVSVDLKTVNNRFLDIHLRVGSELSAIEPSIKRRISSRLSRGRVDVTVSLERTSQVAYELNRPLIAGYVSALKQLQDDFQIGGELDINVLARIPGALQPARDGIDERMIAALNQAIDQALDELERMRQQEGEVLKKELRDRVQKIEALVPTIENAAAGLADAYRQRLQKRIAELLNRGGQVVEIDPARLAQEVAYLADRSDVSEEMVRLRSHLTQFQEALDSQGETGKMLDFLLQELNREANTTLSKSTDLAIKEAGLGIKAEVEKLREQVQNVE